MSSTKTPPPNKHNHRSSVPQSPPLSPLQPKHLHYPTPTPAPTASASSSSANTIPAPSPSSPRTHHPSSPTSNSASSSSPQPHHSPHASPSPSPSGSGSSPSAGSGRSSSPNAHPSSGGSSGSAPRQQPQRRVKLYRLKNDKWMDLGTGNCSGMILEGPSTHTAIDGTLIPGSDEAWIVVRKEGSIGDKPDDILFKSKVQPGPGDYSSDEEEEEEMMLLDGPSGGPQDKVIDVGGYQKQQDTLIVWTDKDTEMDMALSFATNSGCGEIWEFIKASRKLSAEPLTSPSPSPSLSSPQHFPLYSSTSSLPEPTFANLDTVEMAVRSLSRTVVGRERTALLIFKSNYVQKLIKIHDEAVDLESLEDLHRLCRIMQAILLLNDNAIFDLILRDDVILGVVSILEYDPEFPTMKASYRSHLSDPTHFTQVIPIRSASLLAKIHQTHRLHYLKDVVLARVLEDSTFSMLNSAIYFNEVDIVNEIAGDPEFLKELFGLFDEATVPTTTSTSASTSGGSAKVVSNAAMIEEGQAMDGGAALEKDGKGTMTAAAKGKGKAKGKPMAKSIGPQLPPELSGGTSTSKEEDVEMSGSPPLATTTTMNSNSQHLAQQKHDAILFLQQFALMAKNLQIPIRSAFFRSLADRGLLKVIEVALAASTPQTDPRIRGATIEILMTLVDHDPNNVRGYSLKQHAGGKRPLVVFLIELFHKEEDLGLKAQMSEALRVLVDAGGEGGPLEAPPRMRQDDPEAEKFLQYFYDHCISSLLAPIMELPDRSPLDPSLELGATQIALCTHLCDLLCFFITHHTFRSKYFVLSSTISMSVSKLFRTKHKHLKLAALRYFRACIGRNDDFYNRFMIKNDLFHPILQVMAGERGRDNLLASACLDFFENVRASNPKAVINHLMDRYGELMRQLALTLKSIAMLISKWEQNNEPPPKASEASSTATSSSMTRQGRSWAGAGRMDVEEESYFNDSDEEETSASSVGAAGTSRKREAEPDEGDRKRLRVEGSGFGAASIPRSKTWPTASAKAKGKGLVDYGDDEEEEPGGFVRESAVADPAPQGAAAKVEPEEGDAEAFIGPPASKTKEEEEDPLERLQRMRAEKADDDDDSDYSGVGEGHEGCSGTSDNDSGDGAGEACDKRWRDQDCLWEEPDIGQADGSEGRGGRERLRKCGV